jgi:uncharacterized alkaline shock family protein YloU
METERELGAPAERTTSERGKGNKRSGGGEMEATNSVEVEELTHLEESALETSAVAPQLVMGGLTIRELEMMPKMEEIRKLEEIPVGGTTNIEPEVIGAIAGMAARSVEGVASLGTASLRRTIRERLGSAENRGVEVEAGQREVILDINIKMIYGYSIPRTVVKIRETVADRLLRLCGLVAKEINIRVTSLEFPARMPGRVQ